MFIAQFSTKLIFQFIGFLDKFVSICNNWQILPTFTFPFKFDKKSSNYLSIRDPAFVSGNGKTL